MPNFPTTHWRPWCVSLLLPALVLLRPVEITSNAANLDSAHSSAGDLNPAAIAYKLPGQIEWKDTPIGAKMAVMRGDPEKPGPYIVLTKWTPGHMSRPHFHPNDRFITVISGTWWVGTGSKFDPESTVAMPAGSFVTHFAKQIHYDGAKDGECVLQIVGEGPATATPAEAK
jgi:ChrR-like protein with cupin domain